MPPATVTIWPVTCPAARSEHRKATERATSAGSATLRSAIVAVTCATVSSREVRGRHRRHGPAGGDDVHARRRRRAHDLVLEREGEPVGDRGLGGGVVRVPGLAEQPGGGGDQHQAARAGRLHVAQEGARGEERGGEVGVDRRAPAVERRAGRPGRPRRARRRRWPRRRRAGRAPRRRRERARRPAPRRADRPGARRRRARRRAPRRPRGCGGSAARRGRPRRPARARRPSRSRPRRR